MTARREFLIIAIATLITILAWAVLDTVHNRTETEVPQKWKDVVEPINPNFDISEVQNLR